ncbi:MAG: alpha/beta fold hydrolase, partial [Ignavibacteria bacterium]|nr:alpha/beta fold hydrolase [Ignavibacteria bacterium]
MNVFYLLNLLLIIISVQVYSQTDSVKLMEPTGKFAVGTVVYEWTDEKRDFNYSSHNGDKRTIIVQIWFPASIDSNDIIAPYSALSNDYENVKSNSYLRPSFTNKLKKAPLILICPGRGTERFLYSTLIEDLASHGFIVASIDMPGIGYTIYKDGFIVQPSSEFKPPKGMMGGPYEKVDEFFEKPTEIGYNDLMFALLKLTELNENDISNRFTNKIDLTNIGVFGHSLGGRIAGKFASKNENVRAYISMEGIPPRKVRFNGDIKIPVVMLCSSGTWPYAKENYFSLIDNRSNTV